MSKLRVLFLCTGNSCRSQIAEAIVNARYGDRWEAFSAGSRPASMVNPLAIMVLAEIGIDHHGRPKSIDEFTRQSFDLVVTLCDESDEDCPIWLGKGRKLHHPFTDPTKMPGGEKEDIQAFRLVRDGIASLMVELFSP